MKKKNPDCEACKWNNNMNSCFTAMTMRGSPKGYKKVPLVQLYSALIIGECPYWRKK